jgi:hypothetical protein
MDNTKARTALWQMRHLENNWDSYGAEPVDGRAINKALDILETLPGLWDAVPCVDGGVQLEQHRDGFDIEIEIRAVPNQSQSRGR